MQQYQESRFLFRQTSRPWSRANGAPELERSNPEYPACNGVDFGGKLVILFENMIRAFACRRGPLGDQARMAVWLMGPGRNKKEAARLLQPFALGFTRWLASDDDMLTVAIPEQRMAAAPPS